MPQQSKWRPKQIQQIHQLYNSGLSMKEVGQKLNASLNSITSIMRRRNIKRRSASETQKIKFHLSTLSFSSKTKLNTSEKQLKLACLMLYWAEGGKKPDSGLIDFANSDPKMIKLFCQFLRRIYQIDESKLRVYLYCHRLSTAPKLISYWSKITNIPSNQFIKPYIHTNLSPKHGKMIHGLVHIRYADVRLLGLILEDLEQVTAGMVE